MRESVRRYLPIVAAVAVTGAIASSAPVVAASVFDANNAHKVDGYHATQLSSTTYTRHNAAIDDFDGCSYQQIEHKLINTPAKGFLSVWSSVSAARDTDDPDRAELTTRVLVDGHVVSNPRTTQLFDDGVQDGAVDVSAVAKVAKGAHDIVVQAEECTDGMAYIVDRSLVTNFSPFGKIYAVSTPAKVGGAHNG